MTPGAMGDDTMDDITSMKIGFNLFYEHGKFAETLTADNILCVLETTTWRAPSSLKRKSLVLEYR